MPCVHVHSGWCVRYHVACVRYHAACVRYHAAYVRYHAAYGHMHASCQFSCWDAITRHCSSTGTYLKILDVFLLVTSHGYLSLEHRPIL